MRPIRNVLSAKVSPLNPRQWNCSLDCGHDVWVTSKRRPTRKRLRCPRCPDESREPTGEKSNG